MERAVRSVGRMDLPAPLQVGGGTQALQEPVSAVMVVSVWANSSFYGVFWPDGFHATEFVTNMLRLQPFFVCGPLVISHGMRGRRCYRTAIIKVDFRECGQRDEGKLCLLDGCWACRTGGAPGKEDS